MEFYLNQFHVAANGAGIGIAAKYYFNKSVSELDLVESAFIAGSVKGPSKYNPFIKYTPEAKDRAMAYAKERKNYVLRQMYEQKWIDKETLKTAWNSPVPFRKGKFTTREVALVSLVRDQVDKKEILEKLGLESIEDINNAGLKIFTTLDHELQEAAQLEMRRNLSKLEATLDGFAPRKPEYFRPIREIELNEFYDAKVVGLDKDKDGKPIIKLDLGLPKGVIPYQSLVRFAKLLDIPAARGTEKRLTELLQAIKPGQVVYVEAREYNGDTHEGIFELSRRPEVSGGLIALDDGEVRTVVSGLIRRDTTVRFLRQDNLALFLKA